MEDIMTKELQQFFCHRENVVDSLLSKLFRPFDFAAFTNAKAVQSVCGEDLVTKEITVRICNAEPKQKSNRRLKGSGRFGGHPVHLTSNVCGRTSLRVALRIFCQTTTSVYTLFHQRSHHYTAQAVTFDSSVPLLATTLYVMGSHQRYGWAMEHEGSLYF
ncbi:mCG53544 [Mus musculus]|nr:mCG53544 [Mus musculus]